MADDDVVCISDDDERNDGPSTSASSGIRHMGDHSNTYEHGAALEPSVVGNIAFIPRRQNGPPKDEVIYVPDDNDEESFIIGPIRKISMKIIFGCALKAPAEFPYRLLHEINTHMENNVKSVSTATVKCVWECVLEQLSAMRIAYSSHIDVCILCTALYRTTHQHFDYISSNGRTPTNILSTHIHTQTQIISFQSNTTYNNMTNCVCVCAWILILSNLMRAAMSQMFKMSIYTLISNTYIYTQFCC